MSSLRVPAGVSHHRNQSCSRGVLGPRKGYQDRRFDLTGPRLDPKARWGCHRCRSLSPRCRAEGGFNEKV